MGLPNPESLSLSEAVHFVVKRCGCSEAAAKDALRDAGLNNHLIAGGSVARSIHSDLKKLAAHPVRRFEALRAADWGSDIDWKRNRICRHFDVRVTQRSIETWLAQAPAAPAQKNAVRPAKHNASATTNAEVRKRGRTPIKLERVKERMRRDIQEGRCTVDGLNSKLEKVLAQEYAVSRDTARKARNAIVLEFNPDK
jgi:hypothetical protein